MKRLILLVSTLLTYNAIQASNTTDSKTKRGIIGQTSYYGEPSTIRYVQTPIYHDSTSSAATNPSSGYYNANNHRLVIIQNPNPQIKPESEATKQVTVQQILYEYQQTPQNLISNIPINNPFQTATEQRPEIVNPHFVNQPNILNVEPNQYSGVVTPVQHGAVIHHKPIYNPYSNIQNNPQSKYILTNGKVINQPLHANLQTTNYNNHNPYTRINVPPNPQSYVTNLNYQQKPQVVTQRPFKPSPLIPITFNNRYQTQPVAIAKPTTPAPVKEATDEDTEEKAEVQEEQEEEDDSEDHSNYEEDEDDDYKPNYYSKYRYEDDDDDDSHEHYREDDDDEDNTRSYTRYVKKNPKKSYKSKKEPKYSKNDRYKYKKNYEKSKRYSSSTYKNPETDHGNKKPKNQYKSYKYYKSSSNQSPKKDLIEGHQSQNVPIIHNKKIIRQEKWLITKKNNE